MFAVVPTYALHIPGLSDIQDGMVDGTAPAWYRYVVMGEWGTLCHFLKLVRVGTFLTVGN